MTGKGLLYRLSGAMKQQAAEGPAHAKVEKDFDLTADYTNVKAQAVSATLLTPPSM